MEGWAAVVDAVLGVEGDDDVLIEGDEVGQGDRLVFTAQNHGAPGRRGEEVFAGDGGEGAFECGVVCAGIGGDELVGVGAADEG